jgi:hypothetical protein
MTLTSVSVDLMDPCHLFKVGILVTSQTEVPKLTTRETFSS